MTAAEKFLLLRNADVHLRGVAAAVDALSRDPKNEHALGLLGVKLARLAVATLDAERVENKHHQSVV